MRTATIFILAVLFGWPLASGQAAQVVPGAGAVFINAGSGFTQIAGPTEVAPGTSVLVAWDGSAEIRYASCPTVAVQPGQIAIVDENCQAFGLEATTLIVGVGAQALGLALATGVDPKAKRPASP